jgi:thiamine phosphate synthase YjbQ (UPF0047 family)
VIVPIEIDLELEPTRRVEVFDVRAEVLRRHGPVLEPYRRCLYASHHTTAGYLPQSLGARIAARPEGVESYLQLLRTIFPERAGYRHDQIELRTDVPADQRDREPINADSHLAFIAGGLHPSVSYAAQHPRPVYFVDLDGIHEGMRRQRRTTIFAYDDEEVVARTRVVVPVSGHPIDAISLKQPQLGLYDEVAELIARHGVTNGRVRLELGRDEKHAGLTLNEYETLLMQHDLAEVLRNPLGFAAEKARHAWNDPLAVPAKALAYARYDLVRALNQLVDALGLGASRVERLLARTLEVSASRFIRMRRSVDLPVSDARTPGRGALVEGTYQVPILVQWRQAEQPTREVTITLTRFV